MYDVVALSTYSYVNLKSHPFIIYIITTLLRRGYSTSTVCVGYTVADRKGLLQKGHLERVLFHDVGPQGRKAGFIGPSPCLANGHPG